MRSIALATEKLCFSVGDSEVGGKKGENGDVFPYHVYPDNQVVNWLAEKIKKNS